MATIVFVAESFPKFDAVLDLIGGSTVTLTSIIFPCLFWLYLEASERKRKNLNAYSMNDSDKSNNNNNNSVCGIGESAMPSVNFQECVIFSNKFIYEYE